MVLAAQALAEAGLEGRGRYLTAPKKRGSSLKLPLYQDFKTTSPGFRAAGVGYSGHTGCGGRPLRRPAPAQCGGHLGLPT